MKQRTEELSEQERTRTLDALYTAASGISGRAAMKAFLRDLLTESERIMLGRRILIARLLLSGETYEGVRDRLGVGHGTIRNVDRWLKDQMPGYEEAIRTMEETYGKREFRRKYASSMIFRFKKRFPLHFLLFLEKK